MKGIQFAMLKIEGLGSSFCDLGVKLTFFFKNYLFITKNLVCVCVLELAQELDIGTSLSLDPNPKSKPCKNTLENRCMF